MDATDAQTASRNPERGPVELTQWPERLEKEMDRLAAEYSLTHDEKMKAEIFRISALVEMDKAARTTRLGRLVR